MEGERRQPEAPRPAENVLPKQGSVPLTNQEFVTRKVPLAVVCAQCGAKTKRAPDAMPFKEGKYKGGFLCEDCWVLYWEDNPDDVADANTRKWVEQRAREIRLKRAGDGAQLLHDEEGTRAYLTARGTVILDLRRSFGGPDEFDPERFKSLIRAFRSVAKEVEGYEIPPEEPTEKTPQ
jgi:hypothetical protein